MKEFRSLSEVNFINIDTTNILYSFKHTNLYLIRSMIALTESPREYILLLGCLWLG